MKLLLLFLLAVPVVNCVPVEGGIIIVDTPTNRQRESFDSLFKDDDDDDDSWSPLTGFPFGFNENPFWKRFQDVMKNFQNQMNAVFTNPNLDGTPGMFDNLPPNYHNTTSETKNINGSIITVNQTIDTHKDDNSQSVFHIKIVQVKPERPSNESDSNIPGNVIPELNPEEITPGKQNRFKLSDDDGESSTPSVENNEP